MRLLTILLFITLAVASLKSVASKAAAPCNVPGQAIAQMASIAAYQYRDDPAKPKKESYSAVLIGQWWFFRSNDPQDSDSQGLHTVSKYEDGKLDSVPDLRCPADASWVNCAAAWNPYSFLPANSPMAALKNKKPEPINAQACDFDVPVTKWTASTDNGTKKRIASEILNELVEDPKPDDNSSTPVSSNTRALRVVVQPRERGKLRRVYLRDFNLNDPEVHVYFEDSKEKWVMRFRFDANTKPHTSGGGSYGTVTVESVRDWIMEQPYRLYPPPIGKP
jgi:hypothetical protein